MMNACIYQKEVETLNEKTHMLFYYPKNVCQRTDSVRIPSFGQTSQMRLVTIEMV